MYTQLGKSIETIADGRTRSITVIHRELLELKESQKVTRRRGEGLPMGLSPSPALTGVYLGRKELCPSTLKRT